MFPFVHHWIIIKQCSTFRWQVTFGIDFNLSQITKCIRVTWGYSAVNWKVRNQIIKFKVLLWRKICCSLFIQICHIRDSDSEDWFIVEYGFHMHKTLFHNHTKTIKYSSSSLICVFWYLRMLLSLYQLLCIMMMWKM